MFVSVEFGGWSGHSGILLTGLKEKSCFLHLTGTSYPKKNYAMHGTDSPSQLTRDLTSRVLIPSIEDGNAFGVSEEQALAYWRYYKTKTFNHPQWGNIWKDKNRGRGEALNSKYTNENHNCSLFANRLLIAASLQQGIDTNSGFLVTLAHIYTFSIKTPGWFIARSRKVRDQVLNAILDRGEDPRYGYRLENLHQVQYNTRYRPSDNLRDGQPELLPERLRAEYQHDDQAVENPHYTEGVKPEKQTHKWQTDKTTKTAPPGQRFRQNLGMEEGRLLAQLEQLFGSTSGL